ncbi:MAG TPA: hypothetical protein EYP19_15775 [Desulfobacterales bacterium]|nr:hypothetical protein [Desulfobacterales bacterium]
MSDWRSNIQLMQLARKAPKEALAPVIQALEERGTHAGIHFKNTPRKYARFLAEAIAMSHQKEQVVCKRLDQLLELHERSGSTGQMRLLTAIRKSIRACQRI